MTKIAGSGSGSGPISQRHGSADPDPHLNVMDSQHWLEPVSLLHLSPTYTGNVTKQKYLCWKFWTNITVSTER